MKIRLRDIKEVRMSLSIQEQHAQIKLKNGVNLSTTVDAALKIAKIIHTPRDHNAT